MATRRRTTRVPLQMGPDWANLPADVVQIISEKIVFKEQYAHLRLICQQWRRACPPNPRHLIGQVSWLWLPRQSSSSTLSFYDLTRFKVYKFDLHDVIDKNICGHSRGWILLRKDKKFSLINPITREIKSDCLPSLDVPPNILAFARNEKTIDALNAHLNKIILTSSPSDEGCIVVAHFLSDWELGFCKMGDSCWTILKLREYGRGSCSMSDFKYKNGLVYAMNNKGQVTVYDLKNLSHMIIIGNLSYARNLDRLYLVIADEELDGMPLLVRRVKYWQPRCGTVFEVYKCINGKGRSRWRKVRNIGNSVLLLGDAQCELVSLRNIQLNGWEANHVCYRSEKHGEDGYYYDIIEMASIENGSVKEVPNSLGVLHPDRFYYISWFTPSLS
ncbi:hypothetical protein LUZ60_005793 [Juncus effusus]|nr:hypothetical protein LUZ60_005793 [Juncus effusus]